MPNRLRGLRCSTAARPFVTKMARSFKLPRSRRERRRPRWVESRLIEGGSVSFACSLACISLTLHPGNTRVISQTALDHFRTSLAEQRANPYSVLLRRNKLPMGLLEDESKNASGKRVHITEVEPFNDTFGPKAQRKRPRLDIGSMEELSQAATDAADAKSESISHNPWNGLDLIAKFDSQGRGKRRHRGSRPQPCRSIPRLRADLRQGYLSTYLG